MDRFAVVGETTASIASVRAAFGLLTRFPVGGTVVDASGAAAFGVVGLVIGSLAALPLALLSAAGEPLLGAIAAVAVLAAISGGLHLDGLADTADALTASHAIAADRARKDPAVGPAGVVTLLLVLGAQVAAIASATASSGAILTAAALIVAATVSRCIPVLAVVLLRTRTEPGGLGGWFSAHTSSRDATVAGATVVLVAALGTAVGGWPVALAALTGAGVGIATAAGIARARGQMDGDGLGASVEIALAATLVALAVIVP